MLIIGHRGASGRLPELTEISMRTALEQGAQGVECDVRLSRDGVVVCIHDPVVDRVSDGHGPVRRKTLTELRQLNFGTDDIPQKVLTLEQLLKLLKEFPGAHLFIEPKHSISEDTELEAAVAKLLKEHDLDQDPRIHILGFSLRSMLRAKRLMPKLEVIYLHRDWFAPLSPRIARALHRKGLLYGANIKIIKLKQHLKPDYLYTVNHDDEIEVCKERGAKYVATDYPARALQVR